MKYMHRGTESAIKAYCFFQEKLMMGALPSAFEAKPYGGSSIDRLI
jgi:hypothetical protein